ncbi:MAG: type II secretion system GspH family protein [Saccharofermentans sp.]|nr:type II secretion system GspH family protein [Saccharofermentans sp.]
MKKIKKNKKGFTLVELVLVVAIIVILAGVLALNISGYIDRAKNGKKQVESGVSEYSGKIQPLEASVKGYGF